MNKDFKIEPSHLEDQMETLLKLLITRGNQGLTHLECEDLTRNSPCGMITTIRSAVSDLRHDWRWPVLGLPDTQGKSRHARYFIDWATLGTLYNWPVDDLKKQALNAISDGLPIRQFIAFLEHIETKKRKAAKQLALWTDFTPWIRNEAKKDMEFSG